MSHNDSSALIGRTIAGKFVIEAILAAGGTGTVYRARQLGLDRLVALKLLREELARDDDFIERFKREARAASRLEHPNSVRVLDFGQHEDSLLYLAMEYVEGRTLYQVIQEDSPLPDERIVDILSQVLAAVGVAHDMEVIHRDLKPENIMIIRGKSDEGEHAELVKVLDFGIASLGSVVRGSVGMAPEGPRMTKRGLLVGTPEYMAPEQAGGERADRRSDLYSAGVVLYQMLSGRLPFVGESPLTVAVKHITEAPASPSLYAAVNPKLELVCLRALSKLPEERFASAREMRAALRAAINLGPGRSSAPQSVIAGPEVYSGAFSGAFLGAVIAAGRRRRAPLLAALAVAMVLAGAVGARSLLRPQPPALPAALATRPIGPAPSPEPSPPPALAPTPPLTPAPVAPALAAAPNDQPASASRRNKGPTPRGNRDKGKRASRGSLATAAGATQVAPGPPAPQAGGPDPVRAPTAPSSALTPKGLPPALPAAARLPLDLNRATVSIVAVATSSAIPGSNIRAAMSRAPMTRCYHDALRAAGIAAEGTAVLKLKIDIAGYVTAANLENVQFLPEVKACVEKAARVARVKDVDTGEATADLTLRFAYAP